MAELSISSAQWVNEEQTIVLVNGNVSIPVGHRLYAIVEAWVGEGNTIAAYVAPASAPAGPDREAALEALLEHTSKLSSYPQEIKDYAAARRGS